MTDIAPTPAADELPLASVEMVSDPDSRIRPLTPLQRKQLLADLNPNRVAHRKQGGSQLSYLQQWDVRASLIRVFGFGGFDLRIVDITTFPLERDIPKANGGTTAFRATVMVRVSLHIFQLGCTYEEAAVSSQAGAVPGDVIDFALKTATSDAMKRCAINLGTQFGLSLYNNGATADVVKAVQAPDQNGIAMRRAELEDAQAKVALAADIADWETQQGAPAAPTSAPTAPDDQIVQTEVNGPETDPTTGTRQVDDYDAPQPPSGDAMGAVRGAFGGQA